MIFKAHNAMISPLILSTPGHCIGTAICKGCYNAYQEHAVGLAHIQNASNGDKALFRVKIGLIKMLMNVKTVL